MADAKISALTSATTPLDGTEVLPVVQSGTTKQVANNDLRPKQIQSNATSGVLQVAGPAAASTRVMTTPDANFTAARTDAGQTFSGLQNFTFTGGNGPVVNRSDGSGYINFQSGGVNNAQIGEDGSAGFALYTNAATSSKLCMIWRSDGDVRLPIGNLGVATAGKGISFYSNTPAAGMTSQLLNWYEEGTYTATISAGSGSFTDVTQALTYTRIGRIMHVDGKITIITNGTAGTNLSFTMPVASAANDVSFAGRENQTSGIVFGGASISTTTIAITKYDGTYLGGDNYIFPIHFAYKLG